MSLFSRRFAREPFAHTENQEQEAVANGNCGCDAPGGLFAQRGTYPLGWDMMGWDGMGRRTSWSRCLMLLPWRDIVQQRELDSRRQLRLQEENRKAQHIHTEDLRHLRANTTKLLHGVSAVSAFTRKSAPQSRKMHNLFDSSADVNATDVHTQSCEPLQVQPAQFYPPPPCCRHPSQRTTRSVLYEWGLSRSQ